MVLCNTLIRCYTAGMTTEEQWLPVSDYPGYEVSSKGRVRSLDREVIGSWGTPKKLKGKILAQTKVGGDKPSGGRYYACTLFREGKRKMVTIHILVLETFVSSRPEGKWGLHRDDDPENNCLENLYWGTPTENTQDAIRSGRHRTTLESAKTECAQGHQYTTENTYIKPRTGHRECRQCHRDQVNEANRRKRLARQGIA